MKTEKDIREHYEAALAYFNSIKDDCMDCQCQACSSEFTGAWMAAAVLGNILGEPDLPEVTEAYPDMGGFQLCMVDRIIAEHKMGVFTSKQLGTHR